jgi:hypothetical protein
MPVLVNPLDERVLQQGVAAPRLGSMDGKVVLLLDISKPGGSHFLDEVERLLKQRFGVSRIIRETKPTFSKPAPSEVIDRVIRANCDAVIEALAD